MLLMLGKGISGGICYAIHRYAKAINKYMKGYDKIKVSLYLHYCIWIVSVTKVTCRRF